MKRNSMAIDDKKLRVNRNLFKVQTKPYYMLLGEGKSLGYSTTHTKPTWIGRLNTPLEGTPYRYFNLGKADDVSAKSIKDIRPFLENKSIPTIERGLKNETLSYSQAVTCMEHIASIYSITPIVQLETERKNADKTVWDAVLTYQARRKKEVILERVDKDQSVFNKHVFKQLGHFKLQLLSHSQLDDWFLALPGKSGNVNRIRNTLLAALNYAYKCKWTSSRPWDDLDTKPETEKRKYTADRFLEDPQIDAWVKAAPNQPTADLIRMGGLSGFRLGEIWNIKAGDVYADRSRIYLYGKNKGRTVSLGAKVAKFLEPLLEGKSEDDFVFTYPDGTQWTTGRHKKWVKEAAKKAMPGKDYSFYDLRHTWITRMLKGGLDVLSVAQIAGTSIQMIQKFYAEHAFVKTKAELDRVTRQLEEPVTA